MNKNIFPFAVATGLLFSLTTAFAGSATWLANPGSGDWNAASNWTPGGPPNNEADMATFDSSTVNSLLISATTFVDGMTFNPGGETSYTIGAYRSLDFFGSGITNNSGITQNFVVLDIILFANSTSAGSNTAFTVREGPGFAHSEVLFYDNSSAGNATFTINGGTQGDFSSGGTISFESHGSMENATIIVNGSAFHHMDIGFDAPYPAGALFFLGGTAGNATLIANGGIGTGDGGWIRFQGTSTGGTARIKVFGNGRLDISNHTVPPFDVTIGSLEGDGIVLLGGHTLTTGSNDLSTTFSGVLTDKGPSGSGLPSGLTKIGTGTLTLSGANTYTAATTVNGGRLEVDGSIMSPATVNSSGALGGSGVTRNVTVNSGGTVAPGGAQTLHINGNYVQNAGGVLQIDVVGADPNASSQLDITGNATLGGTLEIRFQNGLLPTSGQFIKVLNLTGALSGSFAQIIFPDLRAGFQFQPEFVNGTYQIRALNDGVPATGFLNLSTRMKVGAGDNALIGGFIITPSTGSGQAGNPSTASSGPSGAPKKVILRAIGPSLTSLPGRLADPTLELRDSAGGLLLSNDNWVETTQAQEIMQSGLAPAHEHEAAIIATLSPGSYTAVMRGAGNTTGIGVVEVYDLAADVSAKLANISSRGFVETGDNVMIGGFIAGNQATPVIVRALGPSLTPFGIANALADPTLTLHNAQGAVLAFNNDWRDTEQIAIEGTGISPTDPRESAILATLAPGNYTAIVRGLNNTTGVSLVEVYHLP
jgi:autotransporter-associated beta strand protein